MKIKNDELIRSWNIRNLTIFDTIIDPRHFDISCALTKKYISSEDISLFERHILGYRNYYYELSFITKELIRAMQRSHKPLKSEMIEKNYYKTNHKIIIKDIKRNHEPDLSNPTLNNMITNYLYKNYNKLRINYSNFSYYKILREYKFCKNKISIILNRPPIYGHQYSGYMDLFAIELKVHGKEYIISITLFGFIIKLSSISIYRFLEKILYYYHLKRKHNVYDVDSRRLIKTFILNIGVNRKNGFYIYYMDEFFNNNFKKFNPWKNRFWNLL